MPVPSVFMSSVITGFEDVRDAAAAGIRTVGMHALRSEELSADADSSRRALLDQVGRCDLYLLILGARYGDFGVNETSPTEDEYDEAVRLHKPILVVLQERELEPRQQQFLGRVRGTWGEGVFSGRFKDATDIGAAVAAALSRRQAGVIEDGPDAHQRAVELASEEDRYSGGSGIGVRIALVPLRRGTILDAVALDAPDLGDLLAAALRAADAIPQNVGIEAEVSSAGIRLTGSIAQNWTTPVAFVGVDGTMTVFGSVAVEGQLGFSSVDPDRLRALVSRAGRAAQLILDRVDSRGEVGQVAVAAAVHGAAYKSYGAVSGGATHVSMSLPSVVVAPGEAEIVPRGQLADPALALRIEAAIKRIFADAGSVQG
jgi:hypothetical protein